MEEREHISSRTEVENLSPRFHYYFPFPNPNTQNFFLGLSLREPPERKVGRGGIGHSTATTSALQRAHKERKLKM